MRTRRWLLLVVVACVVVALGLLLGGLDTTPDASKKVLDEWSRGLRLGSASLSQAVALQVAPSGNQVHLAWSKAGEDGMEIMYVRLGGQATREVERQIPPGKFFPRQPRLVLDGRGDLHLFFLASEGLNRPDGVFHAIIGPDGDLLDTPTRLTPTDRPLSDFWAGKGAGETVHLLWSDTSEEAPGIYHKRLVGGGDSDGLAFLLVPEGAEVDAAVDAAGRLHLAWVKKPDPVLRDIYYGRLEAKEAGGPVEGIRVGDTRRETGLVTYPPRLGLDETHAYLFWALWHRSGLAQGMALSFLSSIPLDSGSGPLMAQQIGLPRTSSFSYEQYEGDYPYRHLVFLPPEGVSSYSEYQLMPAPVSSQGPELPVAFTLRMQFRRGSEIEPGLAIFRDGVLWGYQVVGQSGGLSQDPVLAIDEQRQLHLAWIDFMRFGRYDVFYATTAPAALQAIDRPTAHDMVLNALNAIWGMISGLSLLPFVVIVMLPSMALIWAVYIFGSEDDLAVWRIRIFLGVAASLYLTLKFFILGAVFSNPPFLSSLPEALAPALVWGLPALIVAVAALAVVLYARRTARASLFWGFLWFVGVDFFLSLIIYGASFFGE